MPDPLNSPSGNSGFAFLEVTGKDIPFLESTLKRYGFTKLACHISKDVRLYQQGDIVFLVNAEKSGQAANFIANRGTGVNAVGLRVGDADAARKLALERGAQNAKALNGSLETAPAILGMGGTLFYFIENDEVFDAEFKPVPGIMPSEGAGLHSIDHIEFGIRRGNIASWIKFYKDQLDFQDTHGPDSDSPVGKNENKNAKKNIPRNKKSRVIISPRGKTGVTLKEPADEECEIADFLRRYNGEGVRRITLGTKDIDSTIQKLRGNNAPLRNTSLMDDALAPLFFKIVQSKSDESSKEDDFQTLF